MTPDKQLKLIAIVLPEPLASFVREQQKFISETWGCRQALRTPPHITLIPPLKLTDKEILAVESIVYDMSQNHSVFILNINGFDAFKPRVVFIKPDLPEDLKLLQSNLEKGISKRFPGLLENDRDFHPHITLAYRDVTPEKFKEIWKHFRRKEFNTSVKVDRIQILDHTKEGWIKGKSYVLR